MSDPITSEMRGAGVNVSLVTAVSLPINSLNVYLKPHITEAQKIMLEKKLLKILQNRIRATESEVHVYSDCPNGRFSSFELHLHNTPRSQKRYDEILKAICSTICDITDIPAGAIQALFFTPENRHLQFFMQTRTNYRGLGL